MSERDNRLLVEDIREAAQKIMRYTENMDYQVFVADEKTIDAVVRNFEVIGEASNRITNEFKIAHPEIQWRHMTGLRNRIIHEYFGIDYEIIWQIIRMIFPSCYNNYPAKT